MAATNKQDRQGARTVSEVERNYGKRFATLLGLIEDGRDHVDSVESGLKDEILRTNTKLSRTSEKVEIEAERITGIGEEVSQLKISADSIESRVGATESATAQNKQEFEYYKAAVLDTLDGIQNQIDGVIETWFYDYEPTTENYPALEWTEDADKEKHLGDLFYIVDNDEQGGWVYRWAKIDGTYKWIKVEDTEVAKALATAENAKDIADGKRRVFVAQPNPPYDVGDLWSNGEDLYICITSRENGEFTASEWALATAYQTKAQTETQIKQSANNVLIEAKDYTNKTAASLTVSIDEISGKVKDNEGNIYDLSVKATEQQTLIENAQGDATKALEKAGEVHTEYIKGNGVLRTDIDGTGLWQATYTEDGVEKSSVKFDLDKGLFKFKGELASKDGLTYFSVDDTGGMAVRKYDDLSGPNVAIGKIDFHEFDGKYYPYILLGDGSKQKSMRIQWYDDGIWVGNDFVKLDGVFQADDGASGYFINTQTGENWTYVNGKSLSMFEAVFA